MEPCIFTSIVSRMSAGGSSLDETNQLQSDSSASLHTCHHIRCSPHPSARRTAVADQSPAHTGRGVFFLVGGGGEGGAFLQLVCVCCLCLPVQSSLFSSRFFSSFFCPMTDTPVQRTPQGADGEPLSSVAAGMTLGRGVTCSVWNGGFLLFLFPLTLCFLFPLAGVGGLLIPAVISRPPSEREEGGRNWEGGGKSRKICVCLFMNLI